MQDRMQDLARRIASPDVFAANADRENRIMFLPMTAESYRNSVFLDQRAATAPGNPLVVGYDQVRGAVQQAGKSGLLGPECSAFVFHISHCGSTLISRLLGEVDGVLSLREPMLLRRLAEDSLILGKPESWVSAERYERDQDLYLTLLSRRFDDTRHVVIKPTSWVSVIAQELAKRDTGKKIVWLGCGFTEFAATILATDHGVVDVLMTASSQTVRLHRMLGGLDQPLHALDIGEITAMSWLTEMLTMVLAVKELDERVLYVDFDYYLKSPADTLMEIATHLGIDCSADRIGEIATGYLASHYSKDPKAGSFTKATRNERVKISAQKNAAEIGAGRRWLKDVAKDFPEIEDCLT